MRVAAKAPSRSVNLTLPVALIEQARQGGLNSAAIAEAAIAAELDCLARDRFAADIRRSVALHEALVAEHGSVSAEMLSLGDAAG